MTVDFQMFLSMFLVFCCRIFSTSEDIAIENPFDHLQCRDPSFGGGHHDITRRKFLLISGVGGGIGNYLVFYPAAYYFAALTGRVIAPLFLFSFPIVYLLSRVFFPPLFFFVLIFMKDILILDNSLIGEMCSIIHCGFPLYSEAAVAYPMVLPRDGNSVRTVKAGEFSSHIWRQSLIEDRVVIASGYQYKSGWYGDNEFAHQCIDKLTGCPSEDGSCQDRYALERLVVGPFRTKYRDETLRHIYHLAGIPHNLRKGMLGLPHAIAPRLDAAVHLRCQFSHFEWVVGPDDGNSWTDYIKEVDDFLNSTEPGKGMNLFVTVETKILEQYEEIKKRRQIGSPDDAHRERRLLRHHIPDGGEKEEGNSGLVPSHELLSKITKKMNERNTPLIRPNSYNEDITDEGVEGSVGRGQQNLLRRYLSEKGEKGTEETVVFSKQTFDEKIEKEEYHGDGQHDRIFVYLSSDNDRVKEAFANYLENHDKIAVIRVRTNQMIQHAKHVSHLAQNGSIGAFTLTTDWYALSLANILFSWRRDTGFLSTFTQVCVVFLILPLYSSFFPALLVFR
jgi:hypothetical protein